MKMLLKLSGNHNSFVINKHTSLMYAIIIDKEIIERY